MYDVITINKLAKKQFSVERKVPAIFELAVKILCEVCIDFLSIFFF